MKKNVGHQLLRGRGCEGDVTWARVRTMTSDSSSFQSLHPAGFRSAGRTLIRVGCGGPEGPGTGTLPSWKWKSRPERSHLQTRPCVRAPPRPLHPLPAIIFIILIIFIVVVVAVLPPLGGGDDTLR
ncbi:hypothetical protein EYF80_063492 [Liparis tanakae]|uniref:Uncharacterized protein n=1 Tax=Liparis tanakae TaxID=230148 RepID=A0A4Z2ECA8_9TELE|nr:hypothetical protein EYF80_063492 [Liparis tanakae]